VTAKDTSRLAVIGKIGTAGGTGHAIEFAGSAIRALSMEARMTVCNMSIEAGARRRHDRRRRQDHRVPPRPAVLARRPHTGIARSRYWRTLVSDEGARFDSVVTLDASTLTPQVTWGTSPRWSSRSRAAVPDPDKEKDAARRDGIERALAYMGLRANNTPMTDIGIDKVFIGSCTNSRIEDLRAAASSRAALASRPVKLAMVVPGSGLVKAQAEREGLDRVFRDAGFEWREPGCSMCLAMNDDRLEPASAARRRRTAISRAARGRRPHASREPGDGAPRRPIAGHFRRRAPARR
jgi:3-isopropylmalate/(R)-2-methylmalate dehydratase large subunit